MQSMSNNKHRLSCLVRHINQWMTLEGVGKEIVTQKIIDAFKDAGLDSILQVEDIFFMQTDDIYANANTNRQKLFRWLGVLDNGTKRCPNKLFFIEQAIVAAMPPDIKTSYLNAVYAESGVHISLSCATEDLDMDFSVIMTRLIKENSEAQIALSKHPQGLDDAVLNEMEKELAESVAITMQALEGIKTARRKMNIKAVS